jgi:hypothetical protein
MKSKGRGVLDAPVPAPLGYAGPIRALGRRSFSEDGKPRHDGGWSRSYPPP